MRAFESLIVYLTLFITVLCVIAWGLVLFVSDSWIIKRTPYYSIEAGLLHVELSHGYVSQMIGSVIGTVSPSLADALEHMQHGTFMLDEFKEYMCVLPKFVVLANLCSIWQRVQLLTYVLIFCGVAGCICLSIGGGLLYWYAFVKARAAARTWFKILYLLAPVLHICGVALYAAFTWEVQSMFPLMSGPALGTSVMFAGGASILSAMPISIVMCMLGKLEDEIRNEAVSEQKKFARESPHLYGSPAGPLSAPGAFDGGPAQGDGVADAGKWQPAAAEMHLAWQQQQEQQQQQGYLQSGMPQLGSAAGGSAPVAGYGGQSMQSTAYSAGMGHALAGPGGWSGQPGGVHKGATYMP